MALTPGSYAYDTEAKVLLLSQNGTVGSAYFMHTDNICQTLSQFSEGWERVLLRLGVGVMMLRLLTNQRNIPKCVLILLGLLMRGQWYSWCLSPGSKPTFPGQLPEKKMFILLFGEWNSIALFPARPSLSFPSLAVWLSRRGPGTFSHVSDVTGRKPVDFNWTWASMTRMLLCVFTVFPW